MKLFSPAIKPLKNILTLCIFIFLLFSLFQTSFANSYDNGEAIDYWATDVIEKRIETAEGLYEVFDTYKHSQPYLELNHPIQSAYVGGLYAYIVENDHPKALRLLEQGLKLANIEKDYQAQYLFYKALIELYNSYHDISHLLLYGEQLLNLHKVTKDERHLSLAYYSLTLGHYYALDDKAALKYLNNYAKSYGVTKSISDAIQYHTILAYISLHANDLERARIQLSEVRTILQHADTNNWSLYSAKLHSDLLNLILDSKRGISFEQVWDSYLSIKEITLNTTMSKTLWTLPLLEYGGLILDHYEKYDKAIAYYEEYLGVSEKITYLKNFDAPNNDIRLRLALDYYRIGEFEKSANTYKQIHEDSFNPQNILQSSETLSQIKDISERELISEIDLLMAVKSANESKIKAQRNMIMLLMTFIILFISGASALILQYFRMKKLKNKIFEQSITDFLTQVSTRARIFQLLTTLDLSSKKYGIALLDIDNFKSINDRFGHVVGDEVLRGVALAIKNAIRETDLIGRYGGEEFICVINSDNPDTIVQVTERIRTSVESLRWPYENLKTTISIGALYHPNTCFNDCIEEADVLLYQAKKSGKNKVVFKSLRPL